MSDAEQFLLPPGSVIADEQRGEILKEAGPSRKAMASLMAQAQEAQRVSSLFFRTSLRINKAMERAELLGKFGWTIPMNMTPAGLEWLMSQAESQKKTDHAFECLFLGKDRKAYAGLLESLLKSPGLGPYQPLLKEVTGALDAGSYRICVPALFVVIEGFAYHNWTTKFGNESGRRKFFDRKLKSTLPRSLGFYMWLSIKAFVSALFETAHTTKPLMVNRHWILRYWCRLKNLWQVTCRGQWQFFSGGYRAIQTQTGF